mmetsp:Transcript_11529/g.70908  ORF Transcript_11529/g.70908 Transcript_11529/m.70908 type:complete len:304 (+) Transcript_11529:657-1568(+)
MKLLTPLVMSCLLLGETNVENTSLHWVFTRRDMAIHKTSLTLTLRKMLSLLVLQNHSRVAERDAQLVDLVLFSISAILGIGSQPVACSLQPTNCAEPLGNGKNADCLCCSLEASKQATISAPVSPASASRALCSELDLTSKTEKSLASVPFSGSVSVPCKRTTWLANLTCCPGDKRTTAASSRRDKRMFVRLSVSDSPMPASSLPSTILSLILASATCLARCQSLEVGWRTDLRWTEASISYLSKFTTSIAANLCKSTINCTICGSPDAACDLKFSTTSCDRWKITVPCCMAPSLYILRVERG